MHDKAWTHSRRQQEYVGVTSGRGSPTVQQLTSVEVFSLRAGRESREGGSPRGANAQLLLQLFVKLQLFQSAVLLDAVLQLGSQTPHLPEQLPQFHR